MLKKVLSILILSLSSVIFLYSDNSNDILDNTKIVIFTYHKFNSKGDYSITKLSFMKQINFAKKKGFKLISEKELYDFYYNNGTLPAKSLLITVDDVFIDSYTIIYPYLIKNNIPAIFFVNTNTIDNPNDPSNLYPHWSEIEEISKNSFLSIGNHSASHFNLSKIKKYKNPGIFLKKEILDSEIDLETRLKRSIISYAHPYGVTNDMVNSIVKTKFKLAFTTNKGPNYKEVDPLNLNRYVIFSNTKLDDIEIFLDYEIPLMTRYQRIAEINEKKLIAIKKDKVK